MVEVVAIEPGDIGKMWPIVEPLYQKALKSTDWDQYDTDDLQQMIEEGETLALVAAKGAKIIAALGINLVSHPKKRECVILIAGGDEIDEWLEPIHDVIVTLAKEHQADSIVVHGRSGWARKLAQYGYKQRYVTVELEI